MSYNVAVLIGSLRRNSLNRKMAQALTALAPANLVMQEVVIRDLSFYNEDLDGADAPQSWQDFRAQIRAVDALLFVTPEYNRSVPAGLKNAIDVGSRPISENVWRKKPAAVVSVSPGGIGGFGANHHLRQMLVCVDVYPLQQPEMYIGNGATLFAEDGSIAVAETRTFLARFMDAFTHHIERMTRA